VNSFSFWQKWLVAVGGFLAVFGLFLTVFSQSALMDFIFNRQIDPVFWQAEELSHNTKQFQAWIYGVLGAVIAGWGTSIAFVAQYAFKPREKWAWNCIASGVLVWYVADTAISAFFSVTFNVVFNTITLLLLAIPLGCTRKHFSK
jgi:hypothetical protein